MFNTSLEKIFGVKKYADALTKIVKKRDIKLNFKRNLISINPEKKEAVFEVPDDADSEKKLLETYRVGVFIRPFLRIIYHFEWHGVELHFRTSFC